MHITVAGKQVDTGEALQTHVREQLGGITRKYFDHALEANVTFHRDAKGHGFVCDINLKAGRDLFMRGEGGGPDAHRAFDVAAEHVAKRLRRYRRRVNDHARSLAAGRAAPPGEPAREAVLRPAGEDEADAAEAAVAEGEDNPAVIAEDVTRIESLSVSEAVMRLELLHAPALMFRNRASGAINLVYRRGDGHVGWIDPASG